MLTLKDKIQLAQNDVFRKAVWMAIAECAVQQILSITDPAIMTDEQRLSVRYRQNIADSGDRLFVAAANWVVALPNAGFPESATHDSILQGLGDGSSDAVLKAIVGSYFPLLAQLNTAEEAQQV